MNVRLVTCALLLVASTLAAADDQVRDLAQLVGKKVVVGRFPTCEPGTFTASMDYSGKQATVVSVKSTMLVPTGGTLLLEFEGGKRLDSCLDLLPSNVTTYFTLAPGETLGAASPSGAAAGVAPPTEHLSEAEVK